MEDVFPLLHRICNREDIDSGCVDRMVEQDAGRFYPDEIAWGWVHAETPLRYMSDAAFHEVYISRHDYKHVNYSGRPYTYHLCPWCFEELPSIGAVRKARESAA